MSNDGKFANGAVTGAFSYAAGASYGSGGAANDNDPFGGILGKIWDMFWNTAIGLGDWETIDSLATLATGQLPHFGFGNGALQISNLIDLSSIGGGGAITFGDVQLFNGITPGQTVGVGQSPYIQPNGSHLGGFTYGAHEGSHTIVDDVQGILALPLYLGGAAINGWLTNPYEQKADQHALYGTSPFP